MHKAQRINLVLQRPAAPFALAVALFMLMSSAPAPAAAEYSAAYAPAQTFTNLYLTANVAEAASNNAFMSYLHKVRAPSFAATELETGGGAFGPRMWVGLVGSYSVADAQDGRGNLRGRADGLLAGVNYDFSGLASAGAYLGFTRSRTNLDGSEAGGSGLHLGLQAVAQRKHNFVLSGDLAFSIYFNSGHRSDGALQAEGKFRQYAWTLGGRAEYAFVPARHLAVSPFISLRYLSLNQNSFSERGYLHPTRVKEAATRALYSNLGLRFDIAFSPDDGEVDPYLYVSWRHDFFANSIAYHSVYLKSAWADQYPGRRNFRLSGPTLPADSLDLGIGLKAMFTLQDGRQAGLNLTLDASLAQSVRNVGFYAGLAYRW